MDRLGKRLLAVLLAAVLVFGGMGALGAVPAAAAQTGDDGTTNWDFIVPVTHQKTVPAEYTAIRTAQQLFDIRNDLAGKYILMNDISLAGWGNWVPIGNSTYGFSGVLDENGFEIDNLLITDSYSATGFLGCLQEGTIKNLAVTNGMIVSTNTVSGIGGLTAIARRNSIIENCFFSGNINASSPTVGGLIGSASACVVSNSYNTSDILIAYATTAGGIVGNTGTIDISNCSNSGSIHTKGGYAGGIVGKADLVSNEYAKIQGCRNSAEICVETTGGTAEAGGIAANLYTYNPESVIVDCHNSGNVTAKTSVFPYAAGIVAQCANFMSHCSNTGDISVTATFNGNNGNGSALAAGIVIMGGATIKQCFNAGTVSSEANVTLAGSNYGISSMATGIACSASEITDCFNLGALNAKSTSNQRANISTAGISGSAYINRCYSIGVQIITTANSNDIVTYGGICSGASSYQTIQDCYYLDSTAEKGVGGSNTPTIINVLPLSDSQMREQSSFTGFDFDTVWEMPAGSGYPMLRGVPEQGADPQPQTYAINYNANDGINANGNAPLPQIKTQGQPLTLSSQIPTREGYTFKGWATTATAASAQYQPGGNYATDAAVTLWAVWEKVPIAPLGNINVNVPIYNSTPSNSLKKTVSIPWDDRLFAQPTTQYSHNLAKTAMALSAAAYDAKCIGDAYDDMGFTNWLYYDKGSDGMNCYYIGSKHITVGGESRTLYLVVLRGTSSELLPVPSLEWRSNLLVAFSDGFRDFALEVLSSLKGQITNPNKDIVLVTGHSRGAAAANILGVELNNESLSKPENTYVYTFASPRTTRYPVSSSNIFNIINEEDFVTTMPPLYSWNGEMLVFHRNDVPLMKVKFSELTNGGNIDAVRDSITLDFQGKIAHAHAQEVYLSVLMAYETNPFKNTSNLKRTTTACPVDVAVYNQAGALVGKVVDNKVEVLTGHVMILVLDDIKYIHTPASEKYRLEFLATDVGTMTYTVEDISFTNQAASKKFQNVVLTAGKMMSSEIGGNITTANVRLYVTDSNGNITREIQTNGTESTVTITITNAPTAPLQYRSSVTLTASEPVTWSSDSPKVKVNAATGEVQSVYSFFTKSSTVKITATSLDFQRTASITLQIKPTWWQWLLVVLLFGWIYL